MQKQMAESGKAKIYFDRGTQQYLERFHFGILAVRPNKRKVPPTMEFVQLIHRRLPPN